MPHVVVGTAGHIDHGKSTLVQALTGTDPDRLKEEKLRGITIDLGFAHWRRDDVTVAFVDVPGHERFVRNMLAGVGGIDAVLLVIAADEGVMPQTREHFAICRLLGVRTGIVAITKCDLADDDMRTLLRLEIGELVQGSALEGAPVIELSARTGAGLEELQRLLLGLARQAPSRAVDGPIRLPIDRVFSLRGFGTVVTGTLVSGTLAIEQELEVVPGGRRVKVRGVQVHGAPAPRAQAGQRVALNLASVEVGDLQRGQVVVTPGTLRSSVRLDAWLELLAGTKPLRHGTRVRLHQGTIEVLARVSVVGPAGDSLLVIRPETAQPVRLRLESPAPVTRGDRFVIRSYSPLVTIGGGRVLDPAPPRGGVRTEATLQRLRRLAAPFLEPAGGDREDETLALFVQEAGASGLTPDALVSRAGLASPDVRRRIDRIVETGHAERLAGDVLVGRGWRPRLAAQVVEALERHHRAQPLSQGVPREELRERVFGAAHPALASAVLEDLQASGRVAGRERLAMAGHRVALSEEEGAAATALEQACRQAGLTPPDLASVAAERGIAPHLLERVAGLLVRQQVLVRIGGLHFHQQSLAELRRDLAALKEKEGSQARVNVTTFKTRYGLTRKYAIPLLEYLDRERLTRREGDSRVVL